MTQQSAGPRGPRSVTGTGQLVFWETTKVTFRKKFRVRHALRRCARHTKATLGCEKGKMCPSPSTPAAEPLQRVGVRGRAVGWSEDCYFGKRIATILASASNSRCT